MSILSIQSSVAYGHVGNSAAVFPLQRLGVEVWPVSTVVYSNHVGYGDWGGPMLAADAVRAVVRGVGERGAFAEVDAVLSGYQGGPDVGEVVLEAVEAVRVANPAAIYVCDPVIGNAYSGRYVDPAIPALMRERMVPRADLVTPNQFELAQLTGDDDGTRTRTVDETLSAVDTVRAGGPSTVLVTSVRRPDAPDDTIEMLAVHGDQGWLVRTPRLPTKTHGSGDLTAALFTAHLLETDDARAALERTASSVFEVLRTTFESGRDELALVQAQDAIAHPPQQFRAVSA